MKSNKATAKKYYYALRTDADAADLFLGLETLAEIERVNDLASNPVLNTWMYACTDAMASDECHRMKTGDRQNLANIITYVTLTLLIYKQAGGVDEQGLFFSSQSAADEFGQELAYAAAGYRKGEDCMSGLELIHFIFDEYTSIHMEKDFRLEISQISFAVDCLVEYYYFKGCRNEPLAKKD